MLLFFFPFLVVQGVKWAPGVMQSGSMEALKTQVLSLTLLCHSQTYDSFFLREQDGFLLQLGFHVPCACLEGERGGIAFLSNLIGPAWVISSSWDQYQFSEHWYTHYWLRLIRIFPVKGMGWMAEYNQDSEKKKE